MQKSSIISNKILSFKSQSFIRGIILIQDEVIEDVIQFSEDISLIQISNSFLEWNPTIYENSYVCPGIIDLSVRCEWDSLETITQMAASGGVSLIIQEPSLFNNSSSATGKLFCDIGTIASVETIDTKDSKVYGYKGYLYSPSFLVKGCLDDLPNILAKLENQPLPLFLDCVLPHERLLYNSSPCRHLTLTERLNFNPASSIQFGGAYPEQISDKSSEAEDDQPLMLRHSIGLPEISVKPSKTLTRKSQKLPEDHIINRKLSFNDLYDEIDKKIKKNKYSLLELSALEESSYGQAGITITDSRNRSCSYDGDFTVNSDESPPNYSKRLQSARPSLLKIKVEPLPREDLNYMNHLGKIPEFWEKSGVKTVLNMLNSFHTRVHFTKISSAAALNKIRKSKRKMISADIASHYLCFSDQEIQQGCSEFKDFPPIRSKCNNQLLWDIIKLHGLYSVASHHASIPGSLKHLNGGSFSESLSGINSLGFMLQAVWTKLKENLQVDSYEPLIISMFKWLAMNPAKALNIYERRGSIQKQKFADFVIWKPFEIENNKFRSSESESVYKNLFLQGKILATIVRGQIVYKDGLSFQIDRN